MSLRVKRVLVTGGNGFIGQSVVTHLAEQCQVRVSLRNESATFKRIPNDTVFDKVTIGELSADTDWSLALSDIDVVIHLAGRAHVSRDTAESPIDEFRKVNRDASVNLLRQAAKQNVSRFVFVSSIGVNGNTTLPGSPFSEHSVPNPIEAYAISKFEAEQCLIEEASKLDVELVIVRPPLVYGPTAPGNLNKLLKLVKYCPILPFGLVNNQKSFISITNLVDFLEVCSFHPQAANECFLIAEDEAISTKELTDILANSCNKKVCNLPIPVWIMTKFAKLANKEALANQLFNDLVIDNAKAKKLLGWQPQFSMKSGLPLN
ncbi:NAD-dependent epimerase/dehydratase family protein [Photobacterium indicum]|uniref:UDP-glucose 4-epimerase n=1 Tax=Photobacterium indicum TaxID=81447 RepID=A0A2T3L7Z2_9GAMM|nr:NAD-dependent epimerase/dehydratase family protein [Photobacterium indicum]PSV46806.1 UDP-glucose 4-epimerase [Photobacterium indicum]